jgi:signal peptidase I
MKKMYNAIFKTKIRMGVVFFAVISIALAFTFGPYYRALYVTGESMAPTVDHGDWVIIARGSPKAQVGAVVAIRDDESNDLLLKRVIAHAGDTVEVLYGIVYVNGVEQTTYGHGKISFYCQDCRVLENISHAKMIIPADHIWIIGDNRGYSWYGTVPLKNVEGVLAWPKY